MTGMTLWVRHLVNLMEDVVLRDAADRLARFLLESEPGREGAVKLPGLKRHVASPDTARVQILHPEKLRQVAAGRFPKL